jgi:hypothetical protein
MSAAARGSRNGKPTLCDAVLVSHSTIVWLTIFVMSGIARVIGGGSRMTLRHSVSLGHRGDSKPMGISRTRPREWRATQVLPAFMPVQWRKLAVNVLAIPLIDRVAIKGESDTLQRAGSCAL